MPAIIGPALRPTHLRLLLLLRHLLLLRRRLLLLLLRVLLRRLLLWLGVAVGESARRRQKEGKVQGRYREGTGKVQKGESARRRQPKSRGRLR